MTLPAVEHPHVNPHVKMPKKLNLYFAGSVTAYLPCWAWALMDETDLYASDRGTVETKVQHTPAWAATVGLGKGCAFLNERKWKGKLTIKGHLRDVGIFGEGMDQMTKRCRELLTGITWTAERVTWDENHFASSLCNQAYEEWKKQ